mgnify:CR=1 FL=1
MAKKKQTAAPALIPGAAPTMPYDVMLAHAYDDYIGHVHFPCYVQPKLNGIRGLWVGSQNMLWSRGGKAVSMPQHVAEILCRQFGDVDLDGELYLHGANLQQISGNARRTVTAPDVDLEYWVFDLPIEHLTQEQRVHRMREMAQRLSLTQIRKSKYKKGYQPVRFLMPEIATSIEQVAEIVGVYIKSGYEGGIIRDFAGGYYPGKRSSGLLKFKLFKDEEATCTGFIAGEGKHKGRLGALVVQGKGWQCNVGTGFDDKMRTEIWKKREKYCGLTCTVKYQYKSTFGIPQHPVFLGWRNDL